MILYCMYITHYQWHNLAINAVKSLGVVVYLTNRQQNTVKFNPYIACQRELLSTVSPV